MRLVKWVLGIVVVVFVNSVTDAVGKLVSKREPLFLDQHLKAHEGPVIGIKEQHGQRAELRSPVPAVGAVHHD